MKPSEFWDSTYRELYTYAEANKKQRTEDFKREIVLFDALGNKLLSALASKKPKSVSLVKQTFKELFEEELAPSKTQTIEEQIRILRSMK